MKNQIWKSWLLVILAGVGLPSVLHAQSYSIDWFKIAGGGGTSGGGQFVLSGTIGQSDAGRMTGGSMSIDGGFWAMFSVVQTPGAPLLRVELTSSNAVVVAWPANSTGFRLQQNSVLSTTNWVNVPNAVNPVGGENQVIILPSAGDNYYRLISP